MAEMSKERLMEVRRRADAATKGPWEVFGGDGILEMPGGKLIVSYRADEAFVEEADAEFCAHARTDIPDLLDEIEYLQGLLDACRAERDALAVQVAVMREVVERAWTVANAIDDNPTWLRLSALALADALRALDGKDGGGDA